MKKLLFAGIAVSMLAACSQDEVVPVNNPSNAIKFGVTAENGTRADDIYCNKNPFNQFNVYAAFGGNLYINNDNIENDGTTESPKWENKSGLRYWPDGEVVFYAYRNDQGKFAFDATSPTFNEFTVNPTVASQLDLMYAKKTQKARTQVDLNFRHALSQIVFNAKNTNPNLYVEIEEISVANVYGMGTYTFPTDVNTDSNIDHVDTGAPVYDENGHGKWTLKTKVTDPYNVKVWNNKVALEGAEGAKPSDLTTYGSESKANFEKAMLLLPQVASDFESVTEVKQRPYFLVKCTVYNVADVNATDKTDNVALWGAKGETKNIMIPFTPEWTEGYKYTYTFNFGKGNGGVDPENPDEPVLVPISFGVTIDEFVPVDKPTDMDVTIPEKTENNNTESGAE